MSEIEGGGVSYYRRDTAAVPLCRRPLTPASGCHPTRATWRGGSPSGWAGPSLRSWRERREWMNKIRWRLIYERREKMKTTNCKLGVYWQIYCFVCFNGISLLHWAYVMWQSDANVAECRCNLWGTYLFQNQITALLTVKTLSSAVMLTTSLQIRNPRSTYAPTLLPARWIICWLSFFLWKAECKNTSGTRSEARRRHFANLMKYWGAAAATAPACKNRVRFAQAVRTGKWWEEAERGGIAYSTRKGQSCFCCFLCSIYPGWSGVCVKLPKSQVNHVSYSE